MTRIARLLCLPLLLAACDPAKQIVIRNRTPDAVTLLFESKDRREPLRIALAPGEEKNMPLGFGAWPRPLPDPDPTGRCTRVRFRGDRDFDAIHLRSSASELRVRRRYVLKNGLVLVVK